jgi:hypothetical protein
LVDQLEPLYKAQFIAAGETPTLLAPTMTAVERVKFCFSGQESRVMIIPTAAIAIGAASMQTVLDPVVDGIIELVLKHINEKVDGGQTRIIPVGIPAPEPFGPVPRSSNSPYRIQTVFLVGGFGQSEYLQRRLSHALKGGQRGGQSSKLLVRLRTP